MDDKALNQMKSHVLLEWQQKAPCFTITLILAHGLRMRLPTGAGSGVTHTGYDMKCGEEENPERESRGCAYVVNLLQSASSALTFSLARVHISVLDATCAAYPLMLSLTWLRHFLKKRYRVVRSGSSRCLLWYWDTNVMWGQGGQWGIQQVFLSPIHRPVTTVFLSCHSPLEILPTSIIIIFIPAHFKLGHMWFLWLKSPGGKCDWYCQVLLPWLAPGKVSWSIWWGVPGGWGTHTAFSGKTFRTFRCKLVMKWPSHDP